MASWHGWSRAISRALSKSSLVCHQPSACSCAPAAYRPNNLFLIQKRIRKGLCRRGSGEDQERIRRGLSSPETDLTADR